MEILDVLDENGNLIAKRERVDDGKNLLDGEFNLVVHVWIMNSNGEFIITKRSMNKKNRPNIWEITGGCILSGERSIDGALREVKEELGIELDIDNAKYFSKVKRDKRLVDIWFFKQDFDIKDIVIEPKEVSEVKFVKLEEIISLIEQDLFIQTPKEYIEEFSKFII